MASILRKNTGQFIPISAMVMFTVVIFLVAVVNVYKVTRVKLRMQNIADAAALNLASQQAQALNKVADDNEWLNHMTAGIPSPSDPDADTKLSAALGGSQALGRISDCSFFNARNELILPGISCAENTFDPDNDSLVKSRYIFNSKADAKAYAQTIQTVNGAQRLFIQAYNSFLGADSRMSGSSGLTSFQELLLHDIPELKNDPNIRLIASNTNLGDDNESVLETLENSPSSVKAHKMEPLAFKVQNVEVRYYADARLFGIDFAKGGVEGSTLSTLVSVDPNDPNSAVGWLYPDFGRNTIKVAGSKNPDGEMGIDVMVSKTVNLGPVLRSKTVIARAKAYVVQSSGKTGDRPNGPPIFKPTYWVKLGK